MFETETDDPNSFNRFPSHQILERPSILKGIDKGIIEDENNSVAFIRVGVKKKAYLITECPVCDEAGFTNKDELIEHMQVHLTYKNFMMNSIRQTIDAINSSKNYDVDHIMEMPMGSVLLHLTAEIQSLFQRETQNETSKEFKDQIHKFLENILKEVYPSCNLHVYGSNISGFSTENSDLDLSMSIDLSLAFKSKNQYNSIVSHLGGPVVTDDLCELLIFSRICEILKENNVKDIDLKPSARVRIINFKTPTELVLDVDICLNNDIAIENSKLLRTYSLIDNRVPILGIAIKI